MENKPRDLMSQIEKLTHTLEEVNSFKFIFLRGVVMGVGTFIGATFVAAIVIAIMVQVFDILGLSDIGELLTK